MRFVFKTSYDADISLFKHRAQAVWYGLLLLLVLATPLYFVAIGDAYLLGEITGILILAHCGHGVDAADRAHRTAQPWTCYVHGFGLLS